MITLEYPSTTPTNTLTLPNPTLGNNENLDTKLITKRTMNKRFRTHKRTPIVTKLILSFDILQDQDVSNFRTFLDASERKEIKITLHDSSVWIGHILTVPISFEHNNTCQYATTIEFQGVKQ